MKRAFHTTALSAVLLTAGGLSAQSFTSLGQVVLPESISNDGSIVVGTDSNDPAGGRVFSLDFVPVGSPGSPGTISFINQFPSGYFIGGSARIAGDGSAVARNMDDGTGVQVAGRWEASTQFWNNLGNLPYALTCPSLSSAYDISDDGNVVIGLSWEGCKGRAFRWDKATGVMIDMGHQPGGSARASAVSGDGMVAGGFDQGTGRIASMWFPDPLMPTGYRQQIILQGSPGNGEGLGEVAHINHNGTVAVGWGINSQGTYPFRWRQGFGPEPLVVVGSGARARVVTDDGNMIIGEGGDPPQLPGAAPAFTWIWTQEDGALAFDAFLQQQGITIPPGDPITFLSAMTPDGKYITGRRGFPLTIGSILEGFVIRLPDARKYGVNASPANTVDLAGSSAVLGQPFVMTASNLENPIAFLLVSQRSSPALPVAGGALLLDPITLAPFAIPMAPAGTTAASFSLPIPNRPILTGASLYFQALAPDSTQPVGFAWSNGLKMTISQ